MLTFALGPLRVTIGTPTDDSSRLKRLENAIVAVNERTLSLAKAVKTLIEKTDVIGYSIAALDENQKWTDPKKAMEYAEEEEKPV